jgi:hypothetical protein
MVETEETVKLYFEADLLEKVTALKKYYGVQSSTELVIVLVNEKARQLSECPVEVAISGSC